TGLANGRYYNFYVIPHNSVGDGLWAQTDYPVTWDVPAAPAFVAATAGDGKVTVSWSAPGSDGGTIVTGYTVTDGNGSGCTTDGASTSCDVAGLTNGVSYTFSVTATNAVGESAAATASATPVAPILLGTTDSLTVLAAALKADVSTLTGYNETHLAHGSQWYLNGYSFGFAPAGMAISQNSADVTGIFSGAPYGLGQRLSWHTNDTGFRGGWRAGSYVWLNGSSDTWRVMYTSDNPTYYPSGPRNNVSQQALADGGWTLCFAEVYGTYGSSIQGAFDGCQGDYLLVGGIAGIETNLPSAPSAPTAVTATAGNGKVTVSWSTPSDIGFQQVTGYSVSDGNGHGCTTDGEGTSCEVTGLTNGTEYTFTVTATNASGTSDASASASATPLTTPGAPTGVSAKAADGSAVVSWSAPSSDGGAAITAYKVTASTGQTCETAVGVSLDLYSCTVDGLDNLKWLTFSVVATNSAGDSLASEPSDAIVLHTADFQVWVATPNIARDGGSTDIYVFGATGDIADVRLKVGNQVMHDAPDEDGTVVFNFTAYNGAASRWKAQARAVRGTGSSREVLYASS
ncbi:MAG: hypothetical protein EB027_06175, partial [Actinobacteria bacterium]|nr:hypothetical protein [Actinomycetota bacterium]